jgi:Nucleotidyl transferase AbiEii toxin, Type IV TA system
MVKPPVNLAASIKSRLLNIARERSQVFDVLLVRFALERILFRLSVSPYRDKYILKGGLLVTAWTGNDNRTTKDADFLGYGDNKPDKLIAVFRAIMKIEANDGIIFDLDGLAAEPIREDAEYGGIRIKTTAFLEQTRIPITIDIGFGDELADPSHKIDFPSLLDFPAAHLRAYSPASVMAEKFHAIVDLGEINGRMKDYFDLWSIPMSMTILPDDLDAAIKATFARRGTLIPTSTPIGLSQTMMDDASKQRQWRAYATSIGEDDLDFERVIDAIRKTLGPSCLRIINAQETSSS